MTTLIAMVPPALAKRVARAADREALTHSELLIVALRSFLGAYESVERTNERTNERTQGAFPRVARVGGKWVEVA